ncbi:MAG: hypothetical protein FWD79_09735 [Desulfobulbus sp.]|nr:hypothetical protein [Desulfobulbus sp.]
MKYVVIPGSFMGPLCLLPSCPARAFVVVESELDAMACLFAAEQAGLPVGALAVGTNRGKPDAAGRAASGAHVWQCHAWRGARCAWSGCRAG